MEICCLLLERENQMRKAFENSYENNNCPSCELPLCHHGICINGTCPKGQVYHSCYETYRTNTRDYPADVTRGRGKKKGWF